MKNVLALTFLVLCINISWAQKTEFSAALSGETYNFRRPNSVKPPTLFYSTSTLGTFSTFQFGSNLGFGVSTSWKRITKNNLIFGFEAGLDILRNKVQQNPRLFFTADELTKIILMPNEFVFNLNTNFLNFSPFLGSRFTEKPISLDFTIGMDIGYFVNSSVGVYDFAVNELIKTSVQSKNYLVDFDFRPRVKIDVNYKKYSLNVSFAQGISNYLSRYPNANRQAYSRVLRFGLAYQIL